jgi:hypothetical protein
LKVFLSSTFLDLFEEREAVLEALHKKRVSTLAMEYFLASPSTPLETALENLRNSDVMILVIGFKAGTLLPDGSGHTYTSAEYEELLRLGKEPLVFVKQERGTQHLPSWCNEEQDPEKKKALDEFKARVCERWTPGYFTTPEGLALAIILALDDWEARGRPGARKTFASTAEYFAGKNPVGHFQILDFGTTLLGREEQIRALDDFAHDERRRVCILSGRGGIGKSKILHDWANSKPSETVFLKDAPHWHEDSEKEIPITCKTLIVDDAHRQETFGKVLQLLQDTVSHRDLKLIVSTRPGSATLLSQQISRQIDPSQVAQLPELQELNRQQSRALAEEVLGNDFRKPSPSDRSNVQENKTARSAASASPVKEKDKLVKTDLFFGEIDRKLAIETVQREHYLHRTCSVTFAFGAFVNDALMGVLTVGKPPSWSMMAGLVGETRQMYSSNPNSRAKDVYELNRLWMHDDLGKNSESQFIGWCLRTLRRLKPSMILVSYADSKMGHVGTVYQATNWLYTGTSKPFADIHPEGYGDYRSVPMSVRGKKLGNRRTWASDPTILRKERSPKHRYVWLANPDDVNILAWPIITAYPKEAADHNKKSSMDNKYVAREDAPAQVLHFA